MEIISHENVDFIKTLNQYFNDIKLNLKIRFELTII